MPGALVNTGLRTVGARSNPGDPRSNPEAARSYPVENRAATPTDVDNSKPPAFGVRNPCPSDGAAADRPIPNNSLPLQFAECTR